MFLSTLNRRKLHCEGTRSLVYVTVIITCVSDELIFNIALCVWCPIQKLK